jgi:hypothetical protein
VAAHIAAASGIGVSGISSRIRLEVVVAWAGTSTDACTSR